MKTEFGCIPYLFKETLYRQNLPTIKPFLVIHEQNLQENESQLLQNILNAVQISPAQTELILIENLENDYWENRKAIFIFSQKNFENLEKYKVLELKGTKCIASDALSDLVLETDKIKKKALWVALKALF